MATIYDVDPHKLILAVAKEIDGTIKTPEWATFVKTGVHKERPPTQENWWQIRAAAVLRTIMAKGPIGVSKLRSKYGGSKNRGVKPDKFKKASGKIIRTILQQLEVAEYVKQAEKGKGRVIAPAGQAILDKVSVQVSKGKVKVVKSAPKIEKPKKEVKVEAEPVENVVIFHGWEDSSKTGFIPELVKNLQGKRYNVIALDLPDTNAPKFDEWFKVAESTIKGLDNLNIIGHSMGGLLALKLAEKYKVNKLVLVAPVGSKPSKEYFDSVAEKLGPKGLEIYTKYQDRDIDVAKITKNANEIIFIFGMKDPWVTDEIRTAYIEKFKDKAKIITNDQYGHMAESENFKKLPELEEVF